jgi:hypothetical protein
MYVGSERCSGCHAESSAPRSVRFGFVYAVALHDMGERAKAVALLSRLHERFDGDFAVTDLLGRCRTKPEPPGRAKITN